jgi:outer membrane protein OmpA-like peptidoglycan-associated protein
VHRHGDHERLRNGPFSAGSVPLVNSHFRSNRAEDAHNGCLKPNQRPEKVAEMKKRFLGGASAVALAAALVVSGPLVVKAQDGSDPVENGTLLLAQDSEQPAEQPVVDTQAQQQAEEEARKAAEEEELKKRQQAEEAARQAEQQAQEAARQAEEQAQEAARQAEEAARQAAEQEELKRRQQEEEASRQAEEAARQAAEQEELKRRQQEEEAARQAEEAAQQAKEQAQPEQPAADQPAEQAQPEQPADGQQTGEQPVEQAQPAVEQPATVEEGQTGKKRKKGGEAAEQPGSEQPVEQAQPEQPAADQPAEQAQPEQPADGQQTGEQPVEQAQPEQPATEQPAAEQQQAEEPRRKKRKDGEEQAADPLPQEVQQQAVEEAKEAPKVSAEAEKPKDIVAEKPVEQLVKEAERAPTAVVSDTITKEDREKLKKAEKRRRENAREDRDEIIGAAIVGAVIGATIPLLGGTLAADEGDRIVVERGGNYFVRKDDSALFRNDDYDIGYERVRGGLVREIVTRPNGSQIITIRDAGGNVLRREKITPDGRRIVLFDTVVEEIRRPYAPVIVPQYVVQLPPEYYVVSARRADRELFYDTFEAPPVYAPPQRYSLQDIRQNERVRGMVRRVDLDTITFDSGSAFVTQSQVRLLGDVAGGMLDVIDRDPGAVFLIEGHTDAVGTELYNLTLSDRRAETVARILSEAYGVPAENLVVQGYGEEFLKVQTLEGERANRRVTVRNITPILQSKAR